MSQQLTLSVVLKLIDEMSSGVKQAVAASEKHLESFGQKAQAAGQKMESIGLRLAGVGVAGQAGLSRLGLDLGTLTSKAIDAEQALYGIAATAGLAGSEAKKMVGEWTTAVNQIAAVTNQSQQSVTAAFQDMIAKGLDPTDAIAMLKPIGQAATASGADIRDMAVAAQASFSKLGIGVDQVGKSLDIMAQSGKAGAFELRDMAGYFDKLTASAANLGMRGQESLAGLSAAAQIARRGTGDAATAATNLDNFLSKLNAAVTYKAFSDMGVDLGKLKEEAKASGDYLGFMAQAIKDISGGDTAKISELFADVQAGAFVQGMVRDLDDYKKIRAEALAASGVAAADFATSMQSARAQLDQFQISASAAISGGDAMKELLSTMTSIATWANEHPDLAKWLIFGTAGLAVGGMAVTGIGALVTVIGSLSTALAGLGAFLLANPLVLGILGVAVGTSAAAYGGFKFGEFLAEQIDIAIRAVSGGKFQSLGSAIYDMVDWFKALPAKIKAALGDVVASMKKVGSDIMQGLMNGITAKYDEVIKKIKNLGSDMLREVKDVLGIRSPSHEMELVGENTVLGMMLGMENEAPALLDTAKQIGEDTAKALAAPFRDNKGRFLPVDAAARAAAEWQRAGQDIEKSLTDALLRGFEGGAGFAENFRDTLKNLFDTLILRPIIQPIAQGAAGMVTGMLGMGASGSAGAAGLLSGGSSLLSAFAPGAISTEIGMFAGGIAETLGASSAFAGGLGSAVATAMPWIGGLLAIGSLLGIFGGKPSNKAAWGNVDISSGALSDIGNMTGKKQASQATMDARDSTTAAISGYSQLLKALGGTASIGTIRTSIGERDGVQFAIDGGKLKKYGDTPEQALAALFDELVAGTSGLADHVKSLLIGFEGVGSEMLAFADALVTISDYQKADPLADMLNAQAEAARTLYQQLQASAVSTNSLAAAFDGSLDSATQLAAAMKSQYALELQLIAQIQAALSSTQAMFGSSIEQIQLAVLDKSGQYDFLRTRTDELYAALEAATDPTQITSLAEQLNKYSMQAFGLLDLEQKQQAAGGFIDYFEKVDALTTERLNATQDSVIAQHDDLSSKIESVMMAVADRMMAAANTPQQVAVTVDVNTPADVEVGYG